MSGIVELNEGDGNPRFSHAAKSKPHTRRVHRKNKKGKKGRQLNEVNLQDLARENFYTPVMKTHPRRQKVEKHLPGRHDQSTHGNRIGAAYGASHSKSYDITGQAAKFMGEEGYQTTDETPKQDRLAARSILRGVRDNKGQRDTLYSGHYVRLGQKDHKEGDSITLPIASASGDYDDAQGYAREREQYAGEKRSVIYEFPPGTKAKGYVKHDDPSPEYGMHQWSEALVSGRFEVVGIREEKDSYHHYGDNAVREYPITVYTLRQTHVYDPDAGKWIELVNKRWHFDPRQPRDRRGRWTDGGFDGLGGDAPNANRLHRDDVSPFPQGDRPVSRRRAAGARSTTPAKKTAAKKSTPAPAKKTAAKKTTTSPAKKTTTAPAAKKTTASPRRVNNSLYDHSTGTVASRSSIPRINRGGTHIQQHADGRPIVTRPYTDPGEAYYQRNAGPNRISNERLKEIFEDPSKMTLAEKRMIASAGGAKALDGEDKIKVDTSRGVRELDRYQVIGQLRSKIAPGSGNSKSGVTRGGLSEERRKKMAEKRRQSGKPSAAEFGKIEKQITEDWSTDGGKTVVCVFCGKKMSPHGMSVETPKPKALGGNYRDRGGRWPAHNSCNTKAGAAAQADPIAYQEEMMKKFNKLPKDVRERLPHVYDYFPQLGAYPGTAAQRKKYMARGPK